ncbi:unnamed protein product [Polarella glacialis]|uniref:Structural maintenance of chromosomes protein n=1 Tax=Polarella glacialis TaxID=89957 RepID=A0A813KUE8_POLGL|nr:unnamed protein product [Polarella glacialis]
MHIKQVIIRGFKTYKEQTTLDEDFSPGTNVVVGFNGSGKSNFFQAILFVLSDQYSSLRAETRKSLLHEGAGQAVLTAYVEVILDNSDRRIPVESDSVSIRRLIGVKKDDWLLDGKHATKAEIFGLLEGAGFAKTSPYYVVQQGKVSELTMMTDVQRLGLLKDISGAGVYDDRRAESVKIMEDTALRRTRTEGLISEIEQKLAALEDEQRELRECERLESRRRTLEYALADREWRSAQDRIEELGARRDEASGKLVELQSQVGSVRQRTAEAEADSERHEEARRGAAERVAGLEGERDRKYEALAKATLQAEEESRRQREGEDQGAERLSELGRTRQEVAAAAQALEVARPEVEAAAVQVRGLEQRRQVAATEREQLLARQGRGQQFNSLEARNQALDVEIQARSAKLNEASRKLADCGEREQKKEDARTHATGAASKGRQSLATSELRLGELGRAVRGLGEKLDAGAERLRLLHQDRGRAVRDVERLRQEALAGQHRLESTMPRASRQAVGAVMRWAEEQGLQERIRGPLLSHIEVAPTFRTAVESCAGMSLFNLLAMDDEVAAEAVKLVRTRKLGAVVVTPLSQLSLKNFEFPQMEGVKALVEVVKCPDWAKPAVQQVFGRAVVCRSMELCEEVVKRYGIDAITLDGDRVSRKGVVTGGFHDPQRFVRVSLAEAIRGAHNKVREANERVPQFEAQIAQEAEQVDALHVERRSRQDERDKVRVEMQRLTEQVQSAEDATSRSARELSDLREWRHRMEVLIGECEASIAAKKTERASKSLSGLPAAAEGRLRNLTAELQELQAQQEAAQLAFQGLRSELEEKEAQLESSLRPRLHALELQAASSSQDDALERAEEAAQGRARLEREHREAADGATAAAAELQQLAGSCKRSQAQREELSAEDARVQEQAAHASVRVDQLNAELTSQSQKKAEVDAKLQGLAAAPAEVEQCRQLAKPQLVRELAEANRALQAFHHVNRKAVEQYENFSEQLVDLRRRLEEIDGGESSIAEALQRIDAQKEEAVLQTLRRVNGHFQQTFVEMVPGGMGKLRVIRRADGDVEMSGDATSQEAAGLGDILGVRIEVSFTGQAQSFLSMGQLSGGQKTVVALSLIFAIQRLEPAPFYLLDEVDAALDASYRSALANLVAKTAKTSQVVLTTFRPEALEKADRCYRVYQQNRASRIDAVSREQAQEVLREQDRLAEAEAEAAALTAS